MGQNKPQSEQKHPEEWEDDLNPDRLGGQNIGAQTQDERAASYPASENKDIVRAFSGFSQQELSEIPVLRPGTRLKEGATYVDLRDTHRTPFTARADQVARGAHWLVPKARVPYPFWNRLLGIGSVERTHEDLT